MQLFELIQDTVAGLGYELVDFETSPRGRMLRVFIDRLPDQGTVTIDDCTAISNQLSRVFTVENIDYDRLEVSSPGATRTLTEERHFRRARTRLVRVETRDGAEVTARLVEVEDGLLVLADEAGATHRLPLATVRRGRVELEMRRIDEVDLGDDDDVED